MDTRLHQTLGHVAILDCETAPDPRAVALAGKGRHMERRALHRLNGYSVLTCEEHEDGTWRMLDLASDSGSDELKLLTGIDAALSAIGAASGTVATWNGIAHDADVLRRRVIANWAFDLRGIASLDTLPHIDLMRTSTRGWRFTWPSLRDACAGLGIATDHLLVAGVADPAPVAVRKSQTDVVATLLVLLHEISLARASPRPLVAGWRELATFLGRTEVRAPHLEQFRHHPLLAALRS